MRVLANAKARVFRDAHGWRARLAGGSLTKHFATWDEAYAYGAQHTAIFRDYWKRKGDS